MVRFKNINNKSILIFISDLIRKIFGGDRLKRISIQISQLLNQIHKEKKKKLIVLDFGCGSMELSKLIQKKIFIKKIIGTDTFEYNFKKEKLEYLSKKKFLKKKIKFDAIIIVDVLHHIGIDKAWKILSQLSKSSDCIIVKDHFEHGFFSRHLLRFVDFYANYAYGVNIPDKYFDKNSWNKIFKKIKLKEKFHVSPFQQHDGIFNLILNKKHHFMSLLKK